MDYMDGRQMKSQARVPAFLGAMMMALMSWATLSMAAPAPLESPREDVETITRGLLKTFESNLDQYKKDSDAFVAEVDRQLSPVVAFDSIARGVMGKYTRRSKPDQIQQFSGVFKDSLVSFYGKALLKLDNTSLTIVKIDPVPDSVLQDYRNGKARQIPVDMMVKTSSRTVAISYSMVHVDGRWKLRNIIVDGINIGIQFRNQFADAMDKHGDVQFVIDHWQDIMKGGKSESLASGEESL